jgi:folate-binding Fe-S cluster repair protein YgfZ
VSLNKGCYVGQETLAKLATYDGVKQQLRHWRGGAAGSCTAGTTLFTAAGERAGVITSALARADGLEGLALVRRSALDAEELFAAGADGAANADMALQISIPAGFVAPPVGAGGLS